MFTCLPSHKRTPTGFTLIELLVVVGVIGVLAAIAIPQYSRYRRGAFNASAKTAAHNVAISEESYFVSHGDYTENYASLVESGGLAIDYNILYGPILVTVVTDPPSYTFTLNHITPASATYTYTSEGSSTLLETGARVTVNDPTVP